MNKQAGFTLVELVIVIVILGLLAAAAVPRFINVADEARTAAVQGMAGGIRSAVSVVQAQYMATGNMTSLAVTMVDGTSVTVNAGTGIPVGTAVGIGNALQSTDGFTVTYAAGVGTFQPTNGGSATCQVTYDGGTGATTATTTGC